MSRLAVMLRTDWRAMGFVWALQEMTPRQIDRVLFRQRTDNKPGGGG